ncbi:hypothetical protein B0H12DRAFT_1109160 [Mycena haematopus]|nr:hypothetical protein B0H12DRAFT_1109160 [Mycena haematopus]
MVRCSRPPSPFHSSPLCPLVPARHSLPPSSRKTQDLVTLIQASCFACLYLGTLRLVPRVVCGATCPQDRAFIRLFKPQRSQAPSSRSYLKLVFVLPSPASSLRDRRPLEQAIKEGRWNAVQ